MAGLVFELSRAAVQAMSGRQLREFLAARGLPAQRLLADRRTVIIQWVG